MNQESLIQNLMFLADWFGQEVTETRMKGYAEEMGSWEDRNILTAIARAKLECRYFPPFVELVALAGLAPITTEAEALAVWDELRRHHVYLIGLKLSPLVKAVVKEMGGRGNFHSSFGNWDSHQEGMKQKEFIRRYLALYVSPKNQMLMQKKKDLKAIT